MVAGFLEVGTDDVLGIGFALGFAQTHLPRGPFAKQPVAARGDAEQHFLVASIFGFEGAFAVVKLGHGIPLSGRRCR